MGVYFSEDRWLRKKYLFIVGVIEDAMELHFVGHYRRYHKIKWGHFDILATGQSDIHCKIKKTLLTPNRPLSRNAETKDFARLTSHPVRG